MRTILFLARYLNSFTLVQCVFNFKLSFSKQILMIINIYFKDVLMSFFLIIFNVAN